MRVWIDFDNSPHVHFFAPIMSGLRRAGIEVIVTARSFAQTEELANSYGMEFVTIGRHRTGVSNVSRAAETLTRAYQLASYVRRFRPNAAISHGSRGLIVAGWLLGIPVMTFIDYEYTSHRLFTKMCDSVLVPSAIPVGHFPEASRHAGKFVPYPGLKEEVYIYDFRPNPAILSELGLDPARLLVTVRPPATWAHYQSPLSNTLLAAAVERLRKEQDAQVVTITRTLEQANSMRSEYRMVGKPFHLLTHAVDALSLMLYSDAVFSGGGTMVREAALLGVKTYSIFGGKLGAADDSLVRQGKLTMIRDPRELDSLRFEKSPAPKLPPSPSSRTRDFILDQILRFVHQRTPRNSGPSEPEMVTTDQGSIGGRGL